MSSKRQGALCAKGMPTCFISGMASAHAEWHADAEFPNVGHGGQYNCPRRFGVDYSVAVMGHDPRRRHLKPKAAAS